ncbi:MAG: competence/damage-inducible protein A [Flavobacteriaceae bacterium]|nr:competence/damage-inducible protein A [Flavobacteriaceae bacterium]
MLAEIITIGDEILIGQIIDTNSAYISKELNKIGVSVYQITSIQDERGHILKAIKEAEENADIIILSGGLGPTKDDITKHTLAEYFNDHLIQNDDVLKHVEELFAKYISTPISDLNRKQALVLSKAKVLHNNFGTAPGMWIEKENKVFISLPGVPYEMKALLTNEVIPKLQDKFHFPFILHSTVLTYGLGESAIAERLDTWEDELPDFIKLAYLPNLGRVRLRLSAKGYNREEIEIEMDSQVKSLLTYIEDIFVGFEEDESIEVIVGKNLKKKGKTVSVAESCTGGKIAERITSHSGSSKFFMGSIVSYATNSKENILQIPKEIILKHSVVSSQVAEMMAVSAVRLFKTDYAIATTGNAGPTKGDSQAEVGTVFIAIATPHSVYSQEFSFGTGRIRVINKATNKAFEMLLKELLKN